MSYIIYHKFKGGKIMNNANVFDVAKYILHKKKQLTTMKLQKLVYYAQAWHLVWEDEELFSEDFEAWANGPVCKELFDIHKGNFQISYKQFKIGSISKLISKEKSSIDAVLNFYGDKDAHWLSMLTHKENPWMEARNGIAEGENCCNIISKESMNIYYGGL
jgi:uncharacterized phage-associated protein